MTRLRGWISARPLLAMLVAMIVGAGLAGSSAMSNVTALKSELSRANVSAQRSTEVEAELEQGIEALEIEVETLGSDLEEVSGERTEIADELDRVTAELAAVQAKRPMPTLVGRFAEAAESLAETYDWQLQVNQRPSTAPVGKILNQQPAPGTVMRQGAIMTVTVAKPLPPGWKDIKVWSGTGPYSTGIVDIPQGKVRVSYSFAGNTNAIIVLNKKPNVWIDLLLNEIGDRSGSTRLYYTGPHWFEIEGGTWTVRLQQWK